MTEDTCCDYCGEVIFLGSGYFEHNGLCICTDCASCYAMMVFEQEAALLRAQSDKLIVSDCEDE